MLLSYPICFFDYVGGFVAVPMIFSGAVLISLIAFYRTLFLLKLPLLIIDDVSIWYFNVLWYNTHKWDKLEVAVLDADIKWLSIGLHNERIFERLLLESLTQNDIEDILQHVKMKCELIESWIRDGGHISNDHFLM